jgi:hypothetical protein
VQLSLAVQDDGNLAPAVSYASGIFGFVAGAKRDEQRTSTFNADLIYDMKEIHDVIKAERAAYNGELPPNSSYACPTAEETNLSGVLGLDTAGLMGVYTGDLNLGDNLSGKTGVFGGSVQFIVTKNLTGVGPTWTLTNWKSVGALAAVSRVNTDSVTFAFAQRNPITLFAPEKEVMAKSTLKGKGDQRVELAAAGERARDYINSIQINAINSSLGKIVSNTN